MNWTGGALGRSRNANASLTAIQKAHFAKARGRLEANHTSPPTFEIFGTLSVRARANNEDYSRRPRTQATSCSGADNNLLWSNHQLESAQDYGSKRTKVSHPTKSNPRAQTTRYPADETRFSPIVTSSQPSSSAFTLQDDCNVSATAQTKQWLQERIEDNLDPALAAIEAQRARLLKMRDWVGILHTKPAKINFTDSNDRDQIGKRRRLSDMKHRSSHPRRRLYGSHSQKPLQEFATRNDHLSQADISVRIGSAVDRGSVRVEGARRSLSKLDHVSAMSDEMLLDERYSDRTASSHNPFRDRRHIDRVNPTMHPEPLNRAITPSAFMDEPRDLGIGHRTSDATEAGQGTFKIEGESSHFNQSPLLARNWYEPVLMVRRPNEESAPIRFVFENTPHSRDSSSDPKTGGPRERDLGLKHSGSHSKGDTLQNPQQEPLTVPYLTVQDSVAAPRFFDTSPLSHETRGYLTKHYNHPLRSARYTDQSQEPIPSMISHEDHMDLGTDPIDGGLSKTPDLPPAEIAGLSPQRMSGDEEEGWKRFVHEDPLGQLEPLEAPPPSWANALFDEADQPIPDIHAAEGEAIKAQAKNPQHIADEDEELWRSFVFGGEDPIQDWTIEPSEKEETNTVAQFPSSADPVTQTQPSMEAEVATSPIKQNPHLSEKEAAILSPAAKTNRASRLAVASSLSQTNSDEMLDGGYVQNNGSSFHHFSTLMQENDPTTATATTAHTAPPSSNLAQVSTSPPTSLAPRMGNAITRSVPSSLIAQASVTQVPAPLSSDELAWSPARMSQPPIKQAVVFKKPKRYVGERSSDPVKPVRLGEKAGQRPLRSRGRKRSREKGTTGTAEEGGMWAIGAERVEWDEVLEEEDEILDD